MIQFTKGSDGKWSYTVSDAQGVALSGSGFAEKSDAMGDASRKAAALTAGFRDVRVQE